MLTDFQVQNFRSLQAFEIKGLSRVNLIVGGNNSGKTSILEAAEILLSGEARALWRVPDRREEYLHIDSAEKRLMPDSDVCHLFYGHQLEIGSTFNIYGNNAGPHHFSCKVVQQVGEPTIYSSSASPLIEESDEESNFALQLDGNFFENPITVPLTNDGGIPYGSRRRLSGDSKSAPKVIHHASRRSSLMDLKALWDQIVLTPEEQFVISSLQIIEPDIERIASLSSSRQGNFIMALRDSKARVPIGSMGDGIRHLLAIAMELVGARGGYLLIDEIDTGLHHSTMDKLWKLVIESARRFDIQIIASTHSLDCLRSLAKVTVENPDLRKEIAIHRIERGNPKAITYNAEELEIAIEQEMEIR